MWRRKKRARLEMDDGGSDQFHRFQMATEEEEVTDLIHYWKKHLDSARWHQLARMALCMHSIPAMSSEVERVFSSSKILISDRKNKLGDSVIQAVECLKSWEKAGLVKAEEICQVQELLIALEKKQAAAHASS
jgi:hypothetical protein